MRINSSDVYTSPNSPSKPNKRHHRNNLKQMGLFGQHMAENADKSLNSTIRNEELELSRWHR